MARNRGMVVVFNASPKLPTDWKRVGPVDWLLVNQGEAQAIIAEGSVHEWNLKSLNQIQGKTLAKNIVVTLGGKGAVALASTGKVISVPAIPPIAHVDTTGAGDAFAGHFLATLFNGTKIEESHIGRALLVGSAAGSLAVGIRGAFTAIPSSNAVQSHLQNSSKDKK